MGVESPGKFSKREGLGRISIFTKVLMGILKLSEYLPSMKLDDYSFELHQDRVDK